MHKKKKIWLGGSLILFLILIVTALEGAHWIHHAPFKPDMRHAFLKPCLEYPFGTDNLGRCVFCRIIAGSKTSVFSALFVVIIVFALGTVLGIIAGFAGGVWENVIMKLTLILQSFHTSSGGNCRNSGKWSDKRNPFSLCGLLDYLLPSGKKSDGFS